MTARPRASWFERWKAREHVGDNWNIIRARRDQYRFGGGWVMYAAAFYRIGCGAQKVRHLSRKKRST